MKHAKHYFLVLFISVLIGVGGYALVALWSGGGWAWGGPLLVSWPILFRLGWFMVWKRQARTRANLPWIVALGGLGVIVSFAGTAAGPAVLSVAGFGLLAAYVFWYSRLPSHRGAALVPGNPMPVFAARTVEGQRVTSEQFTGKPVLFLFYRGNWCPFCVAQIKEVAARYGELLERGVEVVLVSPQPASFTRNLARRFSLPLHFWIDEDGGAAKRLGIYDEKGVPAGVGLFGFSSDTVYPTVLIVDREGTILYAHQTDHYRIRPEPDAFLRVLDAHGITGAAPS